MYKKVDTADSIKGNMMSGKSKPQIKAILRRILDPDRDNPVIEVDSTYDWPIIHWQLLDELIDEEFKEHGRTKK